MTGIDTRGGLDSKKGVGFWNDDGSFGALGLKVDALKCSWYYNWTTKPDRLASGILAEFVPMIWNGGEASSAKLAQIRRAGHQTLLGFNEPDHRGQANMSVTEAVKLWPRLMETGLRLGSPAPATISPSKNWLARFMEKAGAKSYRIDFICLHWYGDVTDPDAVARLQDFLESQWLLYRRPIWLTEFSGSTGPWVKLVHPPLTRGKNAAFIRKAVPMLNSLPYLERYAWFEMKWEEAPWAKVALVDPKTGELTVVGKAFREGGEMLNAKC